MREFRHFTYHTEYCCEGSFHKKLYRTPCFADAYRNVNNKSNITYEVHFYKGFEFQKRTGEGNACIVTKNQIISLLNSLNRIFHFFFKVEEYVDDRGYEKYKVILTIKKVPATFHKFVLSNLRCVYEFPHNLLLYDAFKLKEIKPFSKENIFNLLNLTLSCCFDELHDEHLPISGRRICITQTAHDLRKSIRRASKLQHVYSEIGYQCSHLPFERPIDSETNCTAKDMEYWNRDFSERLSVYENAYRNKKEAISKTRIQKTVKG